MDRTEAQPQANLSLLLRSNSLKFRPQGRNAHTAWLFGMKRSVHDLHDEPVIFISCRPLPDWILLQKRFLLYKSFPRPHPPSPVFNTNCWLGSTLPLIPKNCLPKFFPTFFCCSFLKIKIYRKNYKKDLVFLSRQWNHAPYGAFLLSF